MASLASLGGPVFCLIWFGQLLPCFEKEEDRKARQAVRAINGVGISIAWYPKGSQVPTTSVASNLVNFFKSAISSATTLADRESNHDSLTSSSSSGRSSKKEPDKVPARLMIRDSPETGKPEIFVDPMPFPSPTATATATTSDGSSHPPPKKLKTKQQPSVGYKLNIALHRVGRVDFDPATGMIQLMAKPPKDPQQPTKCLVCMQLTKGGDIDVPAANDDVSLFVHHCMVVMEWEKQRCAAAGMNHDEEEEEESRGNFLTHRAQKAAHFAKRELELQQSRRQRESRKAQLVQDSGGLKYTALAMMQRQDNAA